MPSLVEMSSIQGVLYWEVLLYIWCNVNVGSPQPLLHSLGSIDHPLCFLRHYYIFINFVENVYCLLVSTLFMEHEIRRMI